MSDVCEIEEIDNYVNQALEICSRKIKNQSITSREKVLMFKYAVQPLIIKGLLVIKIGATNKAIGYYEIAIKIQEFINDKKGMVYSLNNIALHL